MAKNELKKIQKSAESRDIALLAQEMGFFLEKFDDFKKQTSDDFAELKTNTSGNYGSKVVQNDHEKRIVRLEKAALWVLGTTFSLVFIAVIGLVLTQGGK